MPILEPGLTPQPCEYDCGARVQIERDGTAVHIEGKAKYSFICHNARPDSHYTDDCPLRDRGYGHCSDCCDCFGCQWESEARELPADHPNYRKTYDPERHAPTAIVVGDELAVDLVVNEIKSRLEE